MTTLKIQLVFVFLSMSIAILMSCDSPGSEVLSTQFEIIEYDFGKRYVVSVLDGVGNMSIKEVVRLNSDSILKVTPCFIGSAKAKTIMTLIDEQFADEELANDTLAQILYGDGSEWNSLEVLKHRGQVPMVRFLPIRYSEIMEIVNDCIR